MWRNEKAVIALQRIREEQEKRRQEALVRQIEFLKSLRENHHAA